MGQGAGRERGDELLCRLGQHAADMDAALLQPPNQVERLVGGDPAADDQGDAGFAGRGAEPRGGRWSLGSGRASRHGGSLQIFA
jgi:hypothetical protein